MSLKLYFHPLSSFCQKVLIALYENDSPFEPHLVDLGKEPSRSDFLKIWPVGKFPVLRDDAKGRTIPESTIILEHLERQFPFVGVGKVLLAPTPVDTGLQSYLAENLDIPVEEIQLAEMLTLAADVELEREAAWRLFHLLGASLRNEAKAS